VPSITWPPLITMSSITASLSRAPIQADIARRLADSQIGRGVVGAHPLPSYGNDWLPDDFRRWPLADLQQVCLGGQCSSAAGAAADDLRRSS
jgi:hypothetical protein